MQYLECDPCICSPFSTLCILDGQKHTVEGELRLDATYRKGCRSVVCNQVDVGKGLVLSERGVVR